MPKQRFAQEVVRVMNELLTAMSDDMGISRYRSESDDSFTYRLCYSALGQWCLRVAQNISATTVGSTKHNQTATLNELLLRYSELFPVISDLFIDTQNQQTSFPVHIRRIYEETGYLLTDSDNRNHIANYGRSIELGKSFLYFGIASEESSVCGLGMLSKPTSYRVSVKEFLIRDDLNWEEYFQSRFDIVDFYDRDIDQNDLEFFNPKSKNVPSQSWEKQMTTDCTVARKTDQSVFYRVMRFADGSLQFADEPIEPQTDRFTSYEFRRLYFAVKAHYGSPLKATFALFDDAYSKIRIGGHLPNREYYYLLLLSWPINSAFDKTNFLIRNDLISEISTVLTNLGIEINGGN
jgi:hypothetical protein